jgi:hypothetical protein
MSLSGRFRFDPLDAGWRIADGHALVVSRATGHLHRLDRPATRIWQMVVGAPAPVGVDSVVAALGRAHGTTPPEPAATRAGIERFLHDLVAAGLLRAEGASIAGERSAAVPPRPQFRRIDGAWQLVERIAPAARAFTRRVGDGILLTLPDGAVELLAGEAALLWDRLAVRPRTYVELLDALSEGFALSYDETEHVAAPLLAAWTARGALRGLERVERFPASWHVGDVARDLGRLDPMCPGVSPSDPPAARPLGSAATLREPAPAVEHVAIVCQYGIRGLAPGVEPYSQRCIARLRRLAPDLVILSGGGRHGASALREAESVIGRYLEQLPGPGLWLEKHSTTTWENLQHSLEMLAARSIVPARVSLLGDRARAEKLRLACLLARRRFEAFREVAFHVVPIRRPRFTWRDTRAIQVVLGTAQILEESRGKRLAHTDGR